ncbi:MAG TPA: TetR/AcrR family transcriptional regulator [Trebonia sp.]
MAEATQGQSGQRPLPPGLDLLWGRRERGKRGPRPGLTPDSIVEAAVRVADAEGLEAVSMARTAAELGVTTMALYRHVAGKDELLQLMWNASAFGAEHLVIEGSDWRSRLRAWALIQREMLDRHPWVAHMPLAAPPVAPNSMHFVERGLETMDSTGLPDSDKLRVIGLLSSYTLSEARMADDAKRAAMAARAAGEQAAGQQTATEQAATEQAEPPAGPDGSVPGPPGGADDPVPGPPEDYEGLLRELVDERTFPRLYRIAWSPAPESPPTEHEQFLFGIELILDGVQALIDRIAGGY